MADTIRESAEFLVALDERSRLDFSSLSIPERLELQDAREDNSVGIARAYLAECDAHERTQKRLEEAVKLLRKWYEEGCEVCEGDGSMTYMDDVTGEHVVLVCECMSKVSEFLASIETKGADE